ncbi:uncharacterized protein DUF2852 [Tepidamorphus gemmatus]|uniref:Uncharacterized protein DUF2852 n=1 Tax=Tepidamorphus gemmatus TaxID=747076 RepID=A0A4R3MHH7_9HYPH|nr:DUF2852 domain-containing protein [Tepidamorphus gemmatus]TCT13485.1 uncharacterized protein DUF2852 [Tepidamorphus gemmatus]
MASGASWADAWGPGVTAGPPRATAGKGLVRDPDGRRWKGWEIAAVILGFLIFWPIGLAFLVFKLWGGRAMAWKREHGHEFSWACGRRHRSTRDGLRASTGNSAFEEYKAAELERLERERQRLADEQRAFGEFLEELKRSKDREEFDRFMARRREARSDGPRPDETGGPATA